MSSYSVGCTHLTYKAFAFVPKKKVVMFEQEKNYIFDLPIFVGKNIDCIYMLRDRNRKLYFKFNIT